LISTYLRLPEKPYVETLFAVYTEQTDVLVIGAGPAGTVAASLVHQAGYRVKVVEKQKFPRFVIGESLLPRCMEALEAAGFLEAVKEQGFQEKFGAKFVRDGQGVRLHLLRRFHARLDLDLAGAPGAISIKPSRIPWPAWGCP
jgi:2-polyprenyl-6-methoxyphenol hydroxylase-like FAD-dependent oxidoreductase